MNKIFRIKLKIMPVAVMIGGLVLFSIQSVFAQPLYKVEGSSVDKATFNGWNICLRKLSSINWRRQRE
jgi:hypothetical protein